MNIIKQDNNFIITIPVELKRFNPYDEEGDYGTYPSLIGVITLDQYGNDEIGFAQVIDMDYKDKPDQYTTIKYHWWERKEEFIQKCKELGIEIVMLGKND